jgi:hypothetical protein
VARVAIPPVTERVRRPASHGRGRVACGGEPRNACFSFRLAGHG